MNRIRISHIDELPKTCREKMFPHYPIMIGNERVLCVENESYILPDSITLDMIHQRYKECVYFTKTKENKFKDVKRSFYIKSTGKKQETYEVRQDGYLFSCSCKGYMFRKSCKHVDSIKKELGI